MKDWVVIPSKLPAVLLSSESETEGGLCDGDVIRPPAEGNGGAGRQILQRVQ